ncbi:MAG: hypothetical protein AABX03_03520, partial [Nanoarchaeota archaeon]
MNIVMFLLLAILAVNVIAIALLFGLKAWKKRNMENFEKEFKIGKKHKNHGLSKLKIEPKHYFIIVIYAIVFIVIAYLLIGNLSPNSVPGGNGEYIISADSSLLGDTLSSFYLNPSNVLGEKTSINGENYRLITSQQSFNLVFKPKTIISGNQTGTLEINLLGGMNGGSEIYLNDNLIIPNLDTYELVALYPGTNEDVYVKKSVLAHYDKNYLASGDNAGDFVYKNFPGASIFSQKNLTYSSFKVSGYKQETTKIPTTFRGDLKLAVYAESYLNVDFTKQDLNSYLGDDEYRVDITDINGKSYFTKTYEDDGDRKNTNKLGKEQVFHIELGSLPKGVYFITFNKDKN